MSQRIGHDRAPSFPTDPLAPPSDPDFGGSSSSAGGVQDTAVLQQKDEIVRQQDSDTYVLEVLATEQNIAKLGQLRINQRTLGEMVKGLGTVLDHEVYPSRIFLQGRYIHIYIVDGTLPVRFFW